MGQRVWWGKWVGRVVLGRKIGQLGSGIKSQENKSNSWPRGNFFFPVALKTLLVAAKLGPE